MVARRRLLVSDAERDVVVARLGDHHLAGRLSVDELEERIAHTLRARTARDLSAVERDVPGAPADASLAADLARGAVRLATVVALLALQVALALVCAAVAVLLAAAVAARDRALERARRRLPASR